MQEQENVRMHVVVVTGMSGSGKSVVMDVLEDIGYYCIDNLPPQLIGKFVEICRESENHLQKLAIAADLRSGDMFTDAYRTLLEIKQQADLDVKILYIEAEDEVIIKRYKETRRKHPLDERFGGCLHNAIAYEREQLLRVKGIADYYIETSYFSASQLKEQIREIFLDNSSDSMSIKVTSFGLSTAFLRNPIWCLMCVACRIRTTFRNCGIIPAVKSACRNMSCPLSSPARCWKNSKICWIF